MQDRKGASEAWRKEEQLVCGRQNREKPAQMVRVTALHSQPKMSICWYGRRPGAETRALEDRPGERTGVGCADSLKGLECGRAAAGGCMQ